MRLAIIVKPGSKKGPLVEVGTDTMLTVFVRERAIDGRANEAVLSVLAKHFDIPKTSIVIVHGLAGRVKVIDFPDDITVSQ